MDTSHPGDGQGAHRISSKPDLEAIGIDYIDESVF
jgi:hypothetical protein